MSYMYVCTECCFLICVRIQWAISAQHNVSHTQIYNTQYTYILIRQPWPISMAVPYSSTTTNAPTYSLNRMTTHGRCTCTSTIHTYILEQRAHAHTHTFMQQYFKQCVHLNLVHYNNNNHRSISVIHSLHYTVHTPLQTLFLLQFNNIYFYKSENFVSGSNLVDSQSVLLYAYRDFVFLFYFFALNLMLL